ncbi:NAD-dependent protein deacylase [uncultured Propionivibrio sp.]|uniref:SIR2 family NAD-dependent protein deacylase n=1 Tax=uncultured Propionivibrio sp. TaxID=426737 RepID=UPI0029BFDBF2|nr:NAD-dependent protein deacylase [uncultured Propionivibrio sp.]
MTADALLACREIAGLLRTAQRVLFVTGAGISADSGLPTYRGVGGLYNGEATEDGLEIEDALSGDCLAVRPDITWKYLAQIERNCHHVEPNAAHRAIVALARTHEVVVLTQNIDGLHARAGSRDLIEIHGTLAQRYCQDCGAEADIADTQVPPRCRQCGGVVRPAVVLFGEQLPGPAIERLYDELAKGFDLVFIIGTTAVFPYIAEPVLQAVRRGVPTVEINPATTRLSGSVRYRLATGAAEAMTAICAALEPGGR